ncbi:DUF5105 domain-containing protein [Clostridium beijerinckii]|uniref:DUF5105 domain-containing protein n=1 Tax=Clostridium beijerinckii TaxID=1520 RepID=UPI00047CA701|nr:DUF5105 domain-containing protein [Clostridium beijerinckii]
MKKLKRISVLLLAVMMATIMLVGCGTKATPEESAKIFLDLLLKDDKTNMDKIGMKEKDYTEFRNSFDDGMMRGFENSGLDESILTDDIKTSFKKDIITGLTKIEYEVVSSSTDKNTAKVQVKIKGFDMQKITENGQSEIMKKVTENPSMTKQQIYTESFKLIGGSMASGILKQEPQTITITLTKEGGVWLPSEDDVVALMGAIGQ